MSLVDRLIERARATQARVVLPEGDDPRIIEAAGRIEAEGIAAVTLLGEQDAITAQAEAIGVSIEACELIDPATSDLQEGFAERYTEIREKSSIGAARRAMKKPLYFGSMLVRSGHADAMVAGIANPTRRVIEAAQLCIGLADGISTPSSFFVMAKPEAETLVFADCAVVVDPNSRQLADIAIAAADNRRALLGDEPRVAMLSFSTHGSASHPHASKVQEATALIQSRRGDLAVDGELQADSALIREVAELKLSERGSVAGQANVLVFPDLDAGNIAYKLVQYLGGYEALGPILQGFAKPVADLSRGASVDDVVAVTAMTLALSWSDNVAVNQ